MAIEIDQLYNIVWNLFLAFLYWNIRIFVAFRTISLLLKSCLPLSHFISFVKKTQNAQYFWEIKAFFFFFFNFLLSSFHMQRFFWHILYCVNFFCCVWLLENYWCLMVVNKYSYRMCVKIKKDVKILLLKLLNEDHIFHFFLLCKEIFDKLYIQWRAEVSACSRH